MTHESFSGEDEEKYEDLEFQEIKAVLDDVIRTVDDDIASTIAYQNDLEKEKENLLALYASLGDQELSKDIKQHDKFLQEVKEMLEKLQEQRTRAITAIRAAQENSEKAKELLRNLKSKNVN